MATLFDSASLVMIPSGVKEDKLYSIKPTDGSGDFTFSRGSDIQATRVNSSGLIEKAKVNNLLQSNSFDTTWGGNSYFVTSGQSGYDGTNDAWQLGASPTSSAYIDQGNFSTLRTQSIYAKAGTYDQVSIIVGGYGQGVQFDLTNGTIVTNSNTSLYYPTITPVGATGWYRISVFVAPNAPTYGFLIAPQLLASGGISVGEYIFIQDAMVNHGLIAQDYVETTTTAVVEGLTADLPRLDYSGGASCPSLLLEPSRSNVVTQSEYIQSWSQVNVSTTSNSATSPEGVDNASLSTASGSGNHAPYITLAGSVTSGASYTMSIFYKKGTTRYLRFEDGYTGSGIVIDIDEATATEVNSATNGTIENYGNGWYRASFGFLGHGSGASQAVVYIQDNSGNTSYTASGESVYLYGAQIEAGSYPTSYIPTYGTAANRGADFSEATFAEGTLAPAGGTTLFIEFETSGEVDTTPNTGGFYIKNNAGTLSHFGMSFGYGDRIYSNYANSSTIQWAGGVAENTTHKVAFQFINGGKSFLDGDTRATTSVAWSTKEMGQFELQYGSKVKQAILFPTILTDAECIALTTI